jgi:predicted ester cyclase
VQTGSALPLFFSTDPSGNPTERSSRIRFDIPDNPNQQPTEERELMTAEEKKNLVRRVFAEVISQGKLDVADQLIAPGYVNHTFPELTGSAGFKQVATIFRTAFPDISVVPEQILAEGDIITTRGTARGTHNGDFQGIPPTGKPVSFSYIDIWRVEDGKLVENWVEMDRLGMLQQLGVIPAPEQAAG